MPQKHIFLNHHLTVAYAAGLAVVAECPPRVACVTLEQGIRLAAQRHIAVTSDGIKGAGATGAAVLSPRPYCFRGCRERFGGELVRERPCVGVE